jgi:hypothetical protein
MSSVIGELGTLETSSDVNLGWLIGRPILASLLMAALTPVLTKYALAPFFRRYIEHRFACYDHISNIGMMVLVLSAFISIAAYSGTSVLFGAFLAGSFLTYLPSKHPEGPFVVLTREEVEQNEDKSPTFVHTFQLYCADVQRYLMEPLFFASIGFAIPFLDLWGGETVWKGVVYSLLILFAKVCVLDPPHLPTPILTAHLKQLIVGIWMPLRSVLTGDRKTQSNASAITGSLSSAALLGGAMVARGEIGLLIVQIGYNSTSYVTDMGLYIAVWAILLSTIIGPMMVGLLIKFKAGSIARSPWGTRGAEGHED